MRMSKTSWIFIFISIGIVVLPFILHTIKPWEASIGQIIAIVGFFLALCISIYVALIHLDISKIGENSDSE